MGLKDILKERIIGYRVTSKSYIEHLKKIGVKVGEDVILFRPMNTTIDIQNPHLLEIGNHVMMTGAVTILTHDYSWSVLKRKYGIILGNQRKTVIEDNVFIGWGSTILVGSHIGENSIIGANSVVSGLVESNSVYAGNPARKIMTLDEYYKKRLVKQLAEAVDYVKNYKERFGKEPELAQMDEYFFLFFDPNNQEQRETFNKKLNLLDNYKETIAQAKQRKPLFSTFEEFLQYCNKHISEV